MNKKVIVAMSGGVDSSVAAALLKRPGFYPELGRRVEVIGVFMKFWAPQSDATRIYADSNTDLRGYENRCCSSEAEARARKVAKILKIPFYVFNFEKEFKKRIVDYFLKEYKKGLTPNPCVICNKEIKFGLLFEKALSLDADYIATGHYARIRKFVNSQQIRYSLISAKDENKDQSYFLWMLNQKQLKRILFPVGNYTKTEIRKLAKKFRLPVLNIPESMEICFVKTTINPVKSRKAGVPFSAGQFNGVNPVKSRKAGVPFSAGQFNGVNEFLKRYLKEKPGKIIDREGKIIGQHQGLWFYTIGQRKGIGLSGGPYYVLDKDLKKNLLIVTRNEKDLNKKELLVKNVNWISPKHPALNLRAGATGQAGKKSPHQNKFGTGQAKFPLKVKAKIRYRHRPALATIYHLKSNIYHLIFDRPQRAITPGQSAVFYKGEELLGGGIIN